MPQKIKIMNFVQFRQFYFYLLFLFFRKKDGPQEPSDVLNDIGNMLANLTDELDAMLEEEKRQGLNND